MKEMEVNQEEAEQFGLAHVGVIAFVVIVTLVPILF